MVYGVEVRTFQRGVKGAGEIVRLAGRVLRWVSTIDGGARVLVMRYIILGLMALGFVTCVQAQDIIGEDNLVVFIGEKISVEEFDVGERFREEDEAAEAEGRIILHMDSGVDAHYKVLDVLHGDYEHEDIKFVAWDHYGRFGFSKSKYVLLYVRKYQDGYAHEKYTYNSISPLKAGGFAVCGDPYLHIDEYDREFVTPRPLRRYEFSPAVIFKISDYLVAENERDNFSEEEIAKIATDVAAEFSAPVYEVQNDIAICRMGTSVEEVFKLRYLTDLLASRMYGECSEAFDYDKMGITRNDYKKRNEWIDACVLEKRRAYHRAHPDRGE